LNAETSLKLEKIRHLDLREFSAVESGTPVRDVVEQLRHERHNCALVMKAGDLIGIFTDRDVLRKIVTNPAVWDQPIDEYMTAQPTTAQPDEAADEALRMMNSGHFRNVPVLDDSGHVLGNVTHYAFIKFLADQFPREIYNLPPDEGGSHEDRYGG
jgi:CBS domain-containing protein